MRSAYRKQYDVHKQWKRASVGEDAAIGQRHDNRSIIYSRIYNVRWSIVCLALKYNHTW